MEPIQASGSPVVERQGKTKEEESYALSNSKNVSTQDSNVPDDSRTHNRILNALKFLGEFQKLRSKEAIDYRSGWHVRLGSLPDCADVVFDPSSPDAFLTVTRPQLTDAPKPAESVKQWLDGAWKEPFTSLRLKPEREIKSDSEEVQSIQLSDHPEVKELCDLYLQEWKQWSEKEQPLRDAFKLYDALYNLRAEFQREPDVYDLFVADGIIACEFGANTVFHPCLIQRVTLDYDSTDAIFQVGVCGVDPELFPGVVSGAGELAVKAFGQFREKLENVDDVWPLAEETTASFLKGFAHSLGSQSQFLLQPTQAIESSPVVFRDPLLIRMRRGLGMTQFIGQVIDDLQTSDYHSPILEQFVGTFHEEDPKPESATSFEGQPDEDETVYFTKPANREQLEIIRHYRAGKAAVVQGPPGTGKTHTIANLIGHFLAEGKNILVTAETTKALSVLRDKVVESLQPLCISVMDNDRQGRDLLEAGVRELSRVKNETKPEQLSTAITQLQHQRQEIVQKLKETRRDIFTARNSELVPLFAVGEELKPVEAAKFVRSGTGILNWIPGRVEANSSPPLTSLELEALYSSNTGVTYSDEFNDPGNISEINVEVACDDFSSLVAELTRLRANDPKCPIIWSGNIEDDELAVTLRPLLNRLEFLLTELSKTSESWRTQLIEDVLRNPIASEKWIQTLERAAAINHLDQQTFIDRAKHDVKIAPSANLKETRISLEAIKEHFQAGRKINGMVLLTRRSWKQTLESVSLRTGEITTVEEVQVVLSHIDLTLARQDFISIWNTVANSIGLPVFQVIEAEPEKKALDLKDAIESCLKWNSLTWEPLCADISDSRFDIDSARAIVPVAQTSLGFVGRVTYMCHTILIPAISDVMSLRRLKDLELKVQAQGQTLTILYSTCRSPILESLRESVMNLDPIQYAAGIKDLEKAKQLADTVRQRRSLLHKLRPFARAWTESIENREGIHGTDSPPGPLAEAWKWKLLDDELDRRQALSLPTLQSQKERLKVELDATVADLAKNKAWLALHTRITPKAKNALERFSDATRIQTGLRAAVMQREAKQAMAEASNAVPVWIMPIDRVASSFDPSKTRFDVVIVDEASQVGLSGLPILHMAASVIVVGDDKQTEPRSVGIQVSRVDALRDSYLTDIPGSVQWTERMSLYRLAKQSINRELTLLEHFRCVPEIISFSSLLSYQGRIRALREESSVSTRPFVVKHFVPNATNTGKQNQKEVTHLVSLMQAMSEQPEYEDLTFGCVVLRGDKNDQVKLIMEGARKHLGETWIHTSRFQCGTAPNFQGDERDVILLSTVDGPKEDLDAKIRLQSGEANFDDWNKVYNVAVSRARNQIWVVTSLLKENLSGERDIRYKLLDFAENSVEWLRRATEENPKADSPFESAVYRDLVSRGYSLEPQFAVGCYRIDLVATYQDQRCAIECDGEKYHTGDNLQRDIERQTILERCGWRFIRIRGSKYFRDAIATIDEVCASLTELKILPQSLESSSQKLVSSDLHQRVSARAQELRLEWEGPADEDADDDSAVDDHSEEVEMFFN